MPGPKPTPITLSERQQTLLEQIARRHKTPQQQAKRAQLILNMAQGHNNQQAADIVGVHRETAQQWRNRWLEAIDTLTAVELGGMDDKELQTLIVEIFTDVPRAGAPVTFTAEQVAQLLALACEGSASNNCGVGDEIVPSPLILSQSCPLGRRRS